MVGLLIKPEAWWPDGSRRGKLLVVITLKIVYDYATTTMCLNNMLTGFENVGNFFTRLIRTTQSIHCRYSRDWLDSEVWSLGKRLLIQYRFPEPSGLKIEAPRWWRAKYGNYESNLLPLNKHICVNEICIDIKLTLLSPSDACMHQCIHTASNS